MCGRFDRHRPVVDFVEAIDGLIVDGSEPAPPSYNIAPSQQALVACRSESGPVVRALHWGLVPGWVKAPKMARPINARAETVAQKPMFRDAFKISRCLVLCDGYYEWQLQPQGPKQPYRLALEGGAPFVMAGLWARNTRFAAEPLETFCIVTTQASSRCNDIHPRMPVILDREHHQQWLDGSSQSLDTITAMLRPYEKELSVTPVSRIVNSPANNGPQCIAPLQAQN
ncbi:MAG: SOS response-associated peptidase [Arenicellales bacterium]